MTQNWDVCATCCRPEVDCDVISARNVKPVVVHLVINIEAASCNRFRNILQQKYFAMAAAETNIYDSIKRKRIRVSLYQLFHSAGGERVGGQQRYPSVSRKATTYRVWTLFLHLLYIGGPRAKRSAAVSITNDDKNENDEFDATAEIGRGRRVRRHDLLLTFAGICCKFGCSVNDIIGMCSAFSQRNPFA